MKIIYILIFILLLSSVYAININTCSLIDTVSSTDYYLTSNLAEDVGISACLHIKDSSNINIYCNNYIVSGYNNRGSVWVEDSSYVNFYNCDFRFGDSSDGLVYIDYSNHSGIYDSVLQLHGAGNYNDGLQISHSDFFISNNDTFFWNDTRHPALYLFSSSYGLFDDLYIYSGIGGVDDGEGIYVRTGSNFNNFSNIISFGSRESGWRVDGNNNYITNSNSTLNTLSGFDIGGDNNTFNDCYSSINYESGYDVSGDYNNMLSSKTIGDVLIPTLSHSCGINLDGIYNSVNDLYSDSNDLCSLYFYGSYNLINDSIIYVESIQPPKLGGLIKFEGTYNELRDSYLVINTSGKVFYVLGNNNYIFNNYIYIDEDEMIINKSPNFYNYFYKTPYLGDIIYPANNSNPFIGGNYWVNDTGGYSVSCVDANHNGFCDDPFFINGINSTDSYPITDQYQCIPNSNLTVMNITPINRTITAGETFFITMANSYTLDTISNQNCSAPNGISFIDCSYNWTDGVHHYWWGDMDNDTYDTCVAIGSYECDREKDWKSIKNLTSNDVFGTFMSCWTRTYSGDYIDLDGYTITWLPSTISAVLNAEPSTDINLDFDTCNHYLYNNATICMSTKGSSSSSTIATEQPILSCYDWDNDGVYDDAYISTGEQFYVNQSCYGNPTIHNELWNTTVCVENDDLSDSGAYWGEGYVKVLVANQGGTFATTKEYVEFFDDFDTTILHRRPYEVDLDNISDFFNESGFITTKGNESFIQFRGKVNNYSDPVGCIKFSIVSLAYDPSIINYCVYNDSSLKGKTGCNCENTSTSQGYYNYEPKPEDYLLRLDYNITDYDFTFINNDTDVFSESLGLSWFLTSSRSVNVIVTESNGCFNSILNDYDFAYYFYFDGICNDSQWDYYEYYMDYGGFNDECGTCFDNLLSPLINESEIDYGGKFCGFCQENTLKSNDEIWLVLRSFIAMNDTMGGILNRTDYGWVPFQDNWCSDAEETITAINSMIGSALLIILIIVFILILFVIFILLFGGFFWFRLFGTIFKNRRKK